MMIAARNAFLMSGGKPTARDYVQDGLVAMWDGIENAGWGQHDVSATTWADLVGNYNLTKQNNPTIMQDGVSSYATSGISGYFGNATIPAWVNDDTVTTEIVFSLERDAKTFFACAGGCLNIGYMGPRAKKIQMSTASRQLAGIDWTYNQSRHSLTHICGSAKYSAYSCLKIYLDNTEKQVVTAAEYSFGANYGVYIGRMGANLSMNGGNVYCVRIYSRALTAAEVAANYAVDAARFGLLP